MKTTIVADTRWARRLRRLVPWQAGSVAVMGLLVLIGWATRREQLKSVLPGLVTMKVNTALELLALGAALFALHRRTRGWRNVLWTSAALVVLLGLLVQAEYLLGVDLHVDNLLFTDRAPIRYPGRAAPATICCCITVAGSLVLLDLRWRPAIAHLLLLLTLFVPLTTFGGYLYAAPGMFADVQYPVLAVHTAAGLTLLCLGGLFALPDMGLMAVVVSQSTAGRLSRRLLLLAVAVPTLVGLAVLAGQRAGVYTVAFASALIVSCCAVLFGTAVWWTSLVLWRTEQAGAGAEAHRQRAEAELAASEAKFRHLADTIPQLAWMADPEGNVFWYNRRWYEYTGTTLEQMAGWHWQSVHDPKQLAAVMERWVHSIRTGNSFDMEFPLKGADGTFRSFLTRVAPFRNAAGDIVLWFGTNTDIEDRRRVAEERAQSLERERAARAEAEAANQAKDRFLAVLSHELRTPLTPVLATVTFVEKRGDLPEELRLEIGTIRRNIELEARLVDDLLDLTRISRGKIELHREIADVHGLIRAAAEVVRPESDAKRVAVTLQLRAARHHCWADPTRIQQVLINLMQNAVRYTPEGGGAVIVSTADDGTALRMEVSDSGVGIDPAILPKLFTAFEQGERTVTRGLGGLGLGLAISKSFVEMHDGALHGFSQGRGKGATFTVTLATMPEAIVRPQRAAPGPAHRKGQRCTILLVEDHDDTRRVMARLLKSFGCDVKTAGTVAEARVIAEREPIDLLLSDIGLPDGTGHDVMAHARSKGIRGIAISGFGRDEDIRRSRESGFETHLVKPVNFQTLENVVRGVTAVR